MTCHTIIKLVRQAVKLLNKFPAPDRILAMLSPFNILTGTPIVNYLHLKIEFGSYVLVFEDNNSSNTTKSCSTGAIALNPTGNSEGDYFFMSLTTGK